MQIMNVAPIFPTNPKFHQTLHVKYKNWNGCMELISRARLYTTIFRPTCSNHRSSYEKMQLYRPSGRNRTCGFEISVQRSNQLSYIRSPVDERAVSTSSCIFHVYSGWCQCEVWINIKISGIFRVLSEGYTVVSFFSTVGQVSKIVYIL